MHAVVVSERSRVKTVTVTSDLRKLKDIFRIRCEENGILDSYPLARDEKLRVCNVHAIENCDHIE